MKILYLSSILFCVVSIAKPRARDLKIPFIGTPGPVNAITDVPGVEVGFVTKTYGNAPQPAVRTGVTAILPHGKNTDYKIPAGAATLNGNGEMTGITWLEESGFLEGPILFTNTESVGTVRDAVVAWGNIHFPGSENFELPVVGETWDGSLNDIVGQHVTKEDAFQAIETATTGAVAEGNVGGGTGMVLFDFKGGTGSSSRVFQVSHDGPNYTLGVLVQGNFGKRTDMIVAGIPVGPMMPELMPIIHQVTRRDGSILVAIGTDAPLLPTQLNAIAKRASLGIALTGGIGRDTSGDLFIAFSTVPPVKNPDGSYTYRALGNTQLDALFEATAKATEEAVVNALVAADTMVGVLGNTVYGIPTDKLVEILKKYNRIPPTK